MRIGIDVSVLAQPQPAGVATVAEDFVTAMVKRLKQDVVIFALFPRGYFNLLHKRQRRLWPGAEVRWWAVPARLYRLVATFWQNCPWIPVELLTGKLSAAVNIDGYQLPSRVPSISWINDLTIRKFPQWHTLENIALQKQRLEAINQRGNLVVCLSQSTARDFRYYYPHFRGEVMVIYPDIAPRFQRLPKIQVESELETRWQLKRNYF